MPHTEQPHYPGLEPILDRIAGWINDYRRASQVRAEFSEVGNDEVARIAHDLNVTPGELASLATKTTGSVDLLYKMLEALGFDREDKDLNDPRMIRDLERLCFACDQKARCAHDLEAGAAKEHYREFCPNAYTLDVLKSRPR